MAVAPEDSAGITRAAGLVGALTLLSRILGLIRDSVVAALFPRLATDAFYVAFTIPNVLRRLLAEGALTVAFIPVFTEYRERRSIAEARSLVANTLGLALVALTAFTALGIWGAPLLVRGFAYGLTRTPEGIDLATHLTRLVFPYLITVGLTALAMGVLNTYRHFAAPAVAPVLLNVCIIGSALAGPGLLRPWGLQPTGALAVGAVLGGAAQLALQLPFVARQQMLVAPRLALRDPGVARILRLMAPSVFALAVYQINVMLARLFASFLDAGAISALYYSQRLIEFPVGIFAVALATVSMPAMASQAAAGAVDELRETCNHGLRMMLFVMLPATAGLLALAGPLVAVLFQRGRFTAEMTALTTASLWGFTVGLWAVGGVRQIVQVFYALQDTRTPVKVSALSLVVFAALGALLYRPWGTFGLSLAVTLSTTVSFVLLGLLLRRRLGRLGLRRILRSACRAGLAALLCGLTAWAVARLGEWPRGGAAAGNYVVLVAAVTAGIVVYAVCCKLLGVEELRDLADGFRRRRQG